MCRRDGALLQADVEALALRRQQQRAKPRQGSTRRRVDHRPDTEHEWLTAPQVASLVGLTPQAITKRIGRGTMPGVMNRGRVWVRADHLELVERARLAQQTKVPALTYFRRRDERVVIDHRSCGSIDWDSSSNK
jgi:hypothetical protein